MKKKSLSNMINIKNLIAIVLFLAINSCSSNKKNEIECDFNHPRNCEDFISKVVYDKGSILPADGIVFLKNWTYYLTYFDNKSNQIEERYIKMNCNCELIYFGDDNPIVSNSLN